MDNRGTVSGRINGATALLFAAQEGHADVVRTLLDSGASVKDLHTESGQTALLIAADRGHNTVCSLLLAHGSNVEEKKPLTGRTALHIAVFGGNTELVKILLAYGAAVDAVDDISRSTPLHLACQEGHLTCVLTLIKAEASLTLPDKQGQCAIHIAARRNRAAIVQAILDHGCATDLVNSSKFIILPHIDIALQPCGPTSKYCLAALQKTPLMVASRYC